MFQEHIHADKEQLVLVRTMMLFLYTTALNQRVMANNLGLVFGKRQLINCTQPTSGRFADSCDYTKKSSGIGSLNFGTIGKNSLVSR